MTPEEEKQWEEFMQKEYEDTKIRVKINELRLEEKEENGEFFDWTYRKGSYANSKFHGAGVIYEYDEELEEWYPIRKFFWSRARLYMASIIRRTTDLNESVLIRDCVKENIEANDYILEKEVYKEIDRLVEDEKRAKEKMKEIDSIINKLDNIIEEE